MQNELFHESLNDALREIMDTLGGAKRIGPLLRPSKAPEPAARWLHDCLNPDRDAHLQPDDVLWLLKEGRRAGCHAAARFLMREAGYAEPVPVDPQDQAAHLVQTIEGASETLHRALNALERFKAHDIARVVPARAAA